VPLRSVEAATRDDAIAAAREQFGPSARVVGVRRVRSGGVLGFFATERYVAEVAPDVAGRPVVPVPAPSRGANTPRDDVAPSDFSSPLASAAPARARATAPARNGAAAWAAEARSLDAGGATPRASSSSARPASSAWPTAGPSAPAPGSWAEQDRVSELAGLLAPRAAEPETPTYSRATFPRATAARDESPSLLRDEDDEPGLPGAPVFSADSASATPSPFTAALARMVAGDRDVRQAVQEALEDPANPRSTGSALPPASGAPSWPAWPGALGAADTSVPSLATHEEEETVGEQVIAPPSMNAGLVEVPPWAAEPEAPASSGSSREEAIAEILRAALAQGPSDEALAGILRKVLAGASPQSALTEPDVLPDVVVEDDVVAEAVLPSFAAPEPVVEPAPVAVEAPVEAPVVQTPLFAAPVVETPVVAPAPVVTRIVPVLAPLPAPATSMWGTPASQTPLWGDPVSLPVAKADAPSWTEPALPEPAPVAVPVVAAEPAAEVAPVVESEAVSAPTTDAVEELTVQSLMEEELPFTEDADEERAELAAAEEIVEEFLAEVEIAELAPMLARTASDPAPMTSLDATTVMPPLSLLPPLPGSRGRGRPPVPPAASRPTAPPAAPPAPPVAPPAAPAEEIPTVDVPVGDLPFTAPPALRSLATVTRLPVAPLMATPEPPEMPELDDTFADEPVTAPPAPVPPAPQAPVQQAPARPAPVVAERTTAPLAPGDVRGRLEALGLPEQLLGPTFTEDVAVRGTYEALTRALALGLPQAPELPSGAGEVLFVVGPGVETLRAARTLAASLRLDPDRVQWATRGDLAGLAPQASRMTTIDAAIERRQDALASGTVTIVAVDAPMRTDAYWMAQMLAVWTPVAVWAVVEATRKPEDLEPWIEGLPRVDALVVQDTDLSADPAAVLRHLAAPVALVDGVRATPHRWASLLCERLEGTPA
jgi:hypothetical protein